MTHVERALNQGHTCGCEELAGIKAALERSARCETAPTATSFASARQI